MSAPQPEDIGLMAKMVVAAGGILALFGSWFGLHKYTHGKIDKKADKAAFDKLTEKVEQHTISRDVYEEHTRSDIRQLDALSSEIIRQRGHVEKIFDEIKDVRQEMSNGHKELMNAINNIRPR